MSRYNCDPFAGNQFRRHEQSNRPSPQNINHFSFLQEMPKNVSNRVWKDVQLERSSSLFKQSKSRIGWEKRQQLTTQKSLGKQLEQEILQVKLRLKEEENKRREQGRLRRELKEKENEIVLKISAAKFKRMKKKQLRQFKKS